MANGKKFKLYRVHTALLDENGEEALNWSAKTVVATDAPHAVSRVRMGKHEFVESVELISTIDRP